MYSTHASLITQAFVTDLFVGVKNYSTKLTNPRCMYSSAGWWNPHPHSDFMAEMVCSALVQETVSRGVSFVLGKREEKASQGHLMERLEMAVSELEFALERAQELRIRHLSLICRRKQIKSAYVEATELLDKHKQQQAVPAGQELQDAHGVKKRKLWVISAKNMLTTSSFAGLSTDDVRRFELYADFADKFVRDVESGCSLHHNTFCNPINCEASP